jgi:hypothetical protein
MREVFLRVLTFPPVRAIPPLLYKAAQKSVNLERFEVRKRQFKTYLHASFLSVNWLLGQPVYLGGRGREMGPLETHIHPDIVSPLRNS